MALRRNDVDLFILNDAPPHLAREVVTRGRRLFVSDDAADHAFRRDAMLRAAYLFDDSDGDGWLDTACLVAPEMCDKSAPPSRSEDPILLQEAVDDSPR